MDSRRSTTWVQVLWAVAGLVLLGGAFLALFAGGDDVTVIAVPLGLAMLFAGASNTLIYHKKRSVLHGAHWLLADGLSTALLSIFPLFNRMVMPGVVPFFFGVWELFSGNNESVISSFKNDLAENNPAKLQKMTSFCVDYIDIRETTREHEKLVKRLIELIRDDSSIDDNEMFRVGNNALLVNKRALPKITEINLADFLLSILSFIVTTERRDNSIGKETIAAWYHNAAVKGRYNGLDGSSIEQAVAVFTPVLSEGSTQTKDEAAKEMNATNNKGESDVADPKRITVNNYGTVQNQKFISIETMNGDINL